jgi:hypothetical protein
MNEIGHFYQDELNPNISYLNDFIKTHSFIFNNPCVLIDDIHIQKNTLDINNLKHNIENIIEKEISVFYESQMYDYNQLLNKNLNNHIKTIKYKNDNTIKEQIVYNNKLYTLSVLEPEYKLTCLGLAFIWSFLRTDNQKNITYTLIDRKFKNIEDIINFYNSKCNVVYY